jgi:hypothetical protein
MGCLLGVGRRAEKEIVREIEGEKCNGIES